MTVLKRLAALAGIALLILVLPPFLYGLATGREDTPGWLVLFEGLAILALIVGGVIFVAVDAAIRHNQRGD